jgi:hypothetical protein
MKEELEAKLIKSYPRFFEHLKNYKGPIMPIQFGFECGDGWYVLIDALMDTINSYIKSKETYPDKQISSKFWRNVLPVVQKWFRNNKFFYKRLNKFERWLKKEALPAPTVDLIQLKEKFGGLRFYIDGGNDYIDGMISLAEDMSYRTCEMCGTSKNVGQTSGWITTICKDCFDKGLTNSKNWKPIIE